MFNYSSKFSVDFFNSCILVLTIIFVDISTVFSMDLARIENRTDAAVSNFGVDGSGTIVAILDRGIDWKNNDFRNDDGTTRIKFIFDLSDNSGATAPGNIYGMGTIYTEAQINNALANNTNLATRDAVGHGSTTTGIAAGNGRNTADRRFRGIAPKASLIIVKAASEGAPAHGTQPAEAAFGNDLIYTTGIDFVRDKAQQLSMPVVMLLNIGSIGGPTDGTSTISRKIDATFGPGKKGIVFVNGSGDDGGQANHAGGIISQGGTSSIQIQKVSTGNLRFDLWYGGNDRFDVSIQTPSGNFGPYTAPANGIRQTINNAVFTMYHNGTGTVFYGATNGKREILIDIAGPVGTYTIQLTGQTSANGRFDATLNPSTFSNANRFLNFIVPGSIWDGAVAQYNICPNSYVLNNNWTDIDGVPRSVTGEGNVGELWLGSSVGPTFDGRLGVDISAPGDFVMTTYNPTSFWATLRFNMVQGGGGFYGRANAVSAAAPQVTGIIALMLQKNPNLDALQIKQMLQRTARSDSFTGVVPNTSFGYGKVNTYAAVAVAQQSAHKPFDFDGDGKADFSIWRPSNAVGVADFFVNRSSNNSLSAVEFGITTDKPVNADYDGDGRTDVAVWREAPATQAAFYILQSSDNTVRTELFGQTGDKPNVVGDFDGDGKADPAVYRNAAFGNQSYFFYRGSLNNPNGNITFLPWGTNGDEGIRGDFDGDGKQDAAVYRPSNSTWYVLRSSNNSLQTANWGLNSDKRFEGDFDGDSKTDFAVFRPSDTTWYILRSSNNQFTAIPFGLATDTLTPADYDGDGKTDIAVFRNGIWYVLQSSNSALNIGYFGTSGDVAVPSSFIQ
jgi:minor extracellular serine protease Vpr